MNGERLFARGRRQIVDSGGPEVLSTSHIAVSCHFAMKVEKSGLGSCPRTQVGDCKQSQDFSEGSSRSAPG